MNWSLVFGSGAIVEDQILGQILNFCYTAYQFMVLQQGVAWMVTSTSTKVSLIDQECVTRFGLFRNPENFGTNYQF